MSRGEQAIVDDNIGRRAREALQGRGQKFIMDATGLSQPQVSRLLNGRATRSTLEIVKKELGWDLLQKIDADPKEISDIALGAYSYCDLKHLKGRYIGYRLGYELPEQIRALGLDIYWADKALRFDEYNRGPRAQGTLSRDHHGVVSHCRISGALHFLTNYEGSRRQMTVNVSTLTDTNILMLTGLQLSVFIPHKGAGEPVVSVMVVLRQPNDLPNEDLFEKVGPMQHYDEQILLALKIARARSKISHDVELATKWLANLPRA